MAERERINTRFQNAKFKRFANITQFMIFSNNMEYDDGDPEPIQGAYYASSSYHKPVFNYFREEQELNLDALLTTVSAEEELRVLKDNNLEVIRSSPEFQLNKRPERPTNRICTSLLCRERLAFILRYALTYVTESDGIQKHIMRYPQMFATKAIERKLNEGVRKGIIWHTQGSGKTALSYYNVRYLTDYFQKQEVIPKFYFIVDRIDLLEQAKLEFTARNLIVYTINSREDFAKDIKTTQVIHNHHGRPEITVVNIQKFRDDPDVIAIKDYDINIQRVFFLDEAHRSYNPRGSFLANLYQSDPNSIKIALTGTPLILDEAKQNKAETKALSSKQIFGDYIHKYYYNKSIADGYTLRLIREAIATNYQIALQQALAQAEVESGSVERKKIYAHKHFVEPMLSYIIHDFERSRGSMNDASIGGMVICDSAEQAKEMFRLFEEHWAKKPEILGVTEANDAVYAQPKVAQDNPKYKADQKNSVKTAQVILHDVGSKQDRKEWVEDFKAGKIDLLFVFNMLLTGFDAKRLKKLYLGRVIRKHNLLQALTRVNRTYKDFRYGYVVDFADIRSEFDATNRAYFEELQAELGDEMALYSDLFKSQEEIEQEIDQIKDVLFRFDTENAEIFSGQISQIQDRETVLALKKALENAKSLYNIIRMQGDFELLNQLDFAKLNLLYRETCNRLDLLNLKENIEHNADTTNLLNVALEEVIFHFVKIGEEELVLADELKSTLRQTREALASNFDQQDPHFISLKEELERLFKLKNLSEVTQAEMLANIDALNKIHDRVKELNRQNKQLRQKYLGDAKYARVHKRLQERQQNTGDIGQSERKIFEALSQVKQDADDQVLNNNQILDNAGYFKNQMLPLVIHRFADDHKIKLNYAASTYINSLIVNEYLNEFHSGSRTW